MPGRRLVINPPVQQVEAVDECASLRDAIVQTTRHL